DRTERRSDVDAGVGTLNELRDLARGRTNKAASCRIDRRETLRGGGVGTRVVRRSRAAVDLEAGRVRSRARHADEVLAIGTERARAEEVRQRRDRRAGLLIPDAEGVE